MEDHRDGRARAGSWRETAFETTIGAGKNHFWHRTC
jgi:hypothetical protein